MKLNKKKKGFTLIELMAVIAIVAILAAVLVPTVNGYITRAKKMAVITQARSVVNAIATYDQSAITDIADTETISDLANATTGKLGKDGFLGKDDIDKLGTGTTVYIVKKINEDPEAANKIKLDSNGNLTNYGSLANTDTTGTP